MLTDPVEGAPDLAVEVLSPASARIGQVGKLRLHERHGVREHLLADPTTDTLAARRAAPAALRG
ncbi:MAG TPA: Uma2 family endonuclease [Thermoanaerobaculia bacterium]